MYTLDQRVMINDAGFEMYGGGKNNPKCLGTVVMIEEGVETWYSVNWDNGRSNDYEAGTLDVVGE